MAATRKISTTSLRNIRDLSKGETIEFLRKHINPNLKCIEDLGTGVDLCLAMNQLFPNSFDLHKLKKGAHLSENDKRNNFNLLREAFRTSGINKNFPSEVMMQQNFQSNFYFAQWFVRFFEANQKRGDKDNNNMKSKVPTKSRKNIQGGARLMPKESTPRSPKSENRSSDILTPTVVLTKAIHRKPILNRSLAYGKFNYSLPVELICKEQTTQTEECLGLEDRVERLVETQRHLQRIGMEQIECIQNLQKDNENLAESLEHTNLQKSYFHKKLDQIEEICEDCPTESLRISLKRVLYEEGLPM